MNIFIIAYIDLDGNGGSATHLREIVNNLGKLDNKVTLLCPKFRSKNLVNCSKIIEVPGFRNKPTKNTIILQGLFGIRMTAYILTHNVDIIYIRHSPFNILPILVSRIVNIPCIIETNYSYKELKMQIPNIILFPIKIIDKLSYNLTDYIVTVSNNLKDDIYSTHNIDKNKIFVIPNGADIDKFKPCNSKNAKELLKLDKDFRYICFVGSMKIWQGLDYLVKSAPIILKDIPNVKFLIVGNGSHLNNVINMTEEMNVRNNFIFYKNVPNERVPIYINAGDICVAPFCKGRIASPIKIYEYMACGKPIIASSINGISDLLEKSSAGIPVPPNDAVQLADNIIKLLNDEKLRDIMGKNARKYVIENYTWKVTAKRILDIYNGYNKNVRR